MKGFLKSFFKFGFTLLLILVPALCFAQDAMSGISSDNPLFGMFTKISFHPHPEDLSVRFLGKMFGMVPGVPELARGKTILGAVFYVFNSGILALSGVFLSYTITKILTETTMDGSAMGKSTTIWTSVRCALSTSLLVPQASGYSMINGIIMWIVVQSIGLANMTWNRALDYLKEGGPVYAAAGVFVDYSLIGEGVTSGVSEIDTTNYIRSVGSSDVLRSLVCAHIVRSALKASQAVKRDELRGLQNPSYSQSQAIAKANKTIPLSSNIFSLYKHDEENGVFIFPYVEGESGKVGTKDSPLSAYGLNMEPEYIPSMSGFCGTISYNTDLNARREPKDSDKDKRYRQAKLIGLKGMIADLDSTAKAIVDKVKRTDSKKLDYETAVVMKDPDKTFFVSTAMKETKGVAALFENSNLTSTVLQGAIKKVMINVQGESVVSWNIGGVQGTPEWPLGAEEMLAAAMNYQINLSSAVIEASVITDKTKEEKFNNAKLEGWISAGGYYRLLIDLKSEVEKEYIAYRLAGYDQQGVRDPKDKLSTPGMRQGEAGSRTLFDSWVYKKAYGPTKQLTAIEAIDADHKGFLINALRWIYLSYRYSKIAGQFEAARTPLGYSSAAELEKSVGGVGHAGAAIFTFKGPAWVNTASLVGLYISMGIGSVLIATVPPIAIPFLLPLPLGFLNVSLGRIYQTWDGMMGESGADIDPILKLKTLGDSMIKNSIFFFTNMQVMFTLMMISITTALSALQIAAMVAAPFSTFGISTGVSLFLTNFTSFLTGMIDLSQTIIFMYLPLALAVIGPMLVTGIMFAVYVPMIPYLLFLFGAISWLISVLVLMAASPIICFLMLWGNSSQENPLLAREAEQFVMQVIGVFFRPTLMIIGLIAGMVLAYIGVDILNIGFKHLVDFVITSDDKGATRLIKQSGVLIVYTFTMLTVINMCYSTIYLLYSETMRVAGISAPAVGMEAQQLEAVKGATRQATEAIGGGVKESATSLKGAKPSYKPDFGKGGKKGATAEATDEAPEDNEGD